MSPLFVKLLFRMPYSQLHVLMVTCWSWQQRQPLEKICIAVRVVCKIRNWLFEPVGVYHAVERMLFYSSFVNSSSKEVGAVSPPSAFSSGASIFIGWPNSMCVPFGSQCKFSAANTPQWFRNTRQLNADASVKVHLKLHHAFLYDASMGLTLCSLKI